MRNIFPVNGRFFTSARSEIFNRDDKHCAQMSDGHTCKVEYFSADTSADYRAEQEEFSLKHGKLMTRFFLRYGIERIPLGIQLPGMFNVSNAVAAAAVALHFRAKPEALRCGDLRVRVCPVAARISVRRRMCAFDRLCAQ